MKFADSSLAQRRSLTMVVSSIGDSGINVIEATSDSWTMYEDGIVIAADRALSKIDFYPWHRVQKLTFAS